MQKELTGAYVASHHEQELYGMWEQSGVFSPHGDSAAPTFSTVMPPPNANGNLHMGHALDITLKDVLVRWHRMKGERTLWVPGADHAGIETQVVFEKQLEKEGRSRFQMERTQFHEEVMAFTLNNKKNMEDQVRMLGASCDWTLEKFTLDQDVVTQVYASFRKMYADGLIYRGNRIVNYSVKYQTAYSDLEIEYEERNDPLYYLKYGQLVVATVRPETTFGDTAVAVHPEDPRYAHLVGTVITVMLATGEQRELPVIADEFVRPDFGTGAVKVTPAHDPNDFDMGQRHKLPLIEVIDRRGRLLPVAGEFQGLKTAEARKAVVAKLEGLGLVDHVDTTYRHSVALCYKSLQPIEPLVMPQWYVKVGPLVVPALEAIERGEVRFYPEGYRKIMVDWLKGLRDWNISRQIWWGIPISGAMPGNPEVANDPDTFDTWFSSSQWPYLALDEKTRSDFYPNSVMETGRDLVFSWVSRMLLMGLYHQGKVPFRDVYFHGMVLDKQGKKMSKSKGNVVSPVELVAKYGADALRFGLLIGSSAGSDMPLPEEKIIGGRNFCNKLWNIAKFVLLQLGETRPSDLPDVHATTDADSTVLAALTKTETSVESHLAAYRFAQALQELHEFTWHAFADTYIEASKNQAGPATTTVLWYCLLESLRMLHPFMPFVTEAIWQRLPERKGMLISGM